MDQYIKRFKQLVLVLALSGIFSHYAIESYIDLVDDFNDVEQLAMPTMMLSDRHPAKIDWAEDEITKDEHNDPYNTTGSALDRATALLKEQDYKYKGVFVVEGVRFRFENILDRERMHEGKPPSDPSAPNDRLHIVNAKPCPSLTINIALDVHDSIEFQCFRVQRVGDSASEVLFWLADGKPFWNGGDIVKDSRELLLAAGDRYLTREEASAEVALIAERNGIEGSSVPERYFRFRSKVLEQRFAVPVVGFEAKLVEYYRLLAGVVFVVAVILLHSCIRLFDLAGTGLREESWILSPPKFEFSATGVLRLVVFVLGGFFFLGAIALPVTALGRFGWELELRTHLLLEVRYITVVTILVLGGAVTYAALAIAKEA